MVKSVRKWRMKWVGHILRNSFLARKMLMRMQKPYEEGSILLDAPQHDTMDELALNWFTETRAAAQLRGGARRV